MGLLKGGRLLLGSYDVVASVLIEGVGERRPTLKAATADFGEFLNRLRWLSSGLQNVYSKTSKRRIIADKLFDIVPKFGNAKILPS